MSDAGIVLMVVLVTALVLALGAVAVLSALYLSLRARFDAQLAQARDGWHERAAAEAQAQLAQWQASELERARQEQHAIAAREAGVQLDQWKQDAEKEIRRDAIQRSQSVTVGKITEHLVPHLPGFGFNPKDARFIGSPIDLLIFDGLDEGDLRRVVFMEVKTGVSSLSTRERRLRDAIQAGKVEWREYRPSVDANAAPPEDGSRQ